RRRVDICRGCTCVAVANGLRPAAQPPANHVGRERAMSNGDHSVPIEQFIQALQTQLDRAQTAMAIKAENLDLPLTFAVKDLSLELRTHVEVVRSEVRIRPAGPGDGDASTLHLALTTITRPMIKENAQPM